MLIEWELPGAGSEENEEFLFSEFRVSFWGGEHSGGER